MKKIAVLFITLLLVCSFVQEYDDFLEKFQRVFDKASIEAIAAVKNPQGKMPAENLKLEVKQSFWCGKSDSAGKHILKDTIWLVTETWQYFGQSFIANLISIAVRDTAQTEDVLDSSECIGYVLTITNYNDCFRNSYGQQAKAITKTMKTLLRDTTYHQRVYDWLRPALKLTWNLFDNKTKNFYRETFKYVHTFNYEAEKEYFESLSNDEKWKFSAYDPDGRFDRRRKAKSFVFRRIYFDHWSMNYTFLWFKKIEKMMI